MNPALSDEADRRRRPVWLIIFADLVALLLAFFVMLFATIEVELTRWSALIDSLSQSLNPDHALVLDRPSARRNVQHLSRRRAIDLAYLESILRETMDAEPSLKTVRLRREEGRLVIALPSDSLFAPGAAAPVPAARRSFQALGEVLRRIGNAVEIYGHTDPTPVGRSVFDSNWELSVARAIAVANELRRAGYTRDLPTFGYADTRFAMLPDGIALNRRYGLARRVDIVILPIKADERG